MQHAWQLACALQLGEVTVNRKKEIGEEEEKGMHDSESFASSMVIRQEMKARS